MSFEQPVDRQPLNPPMAIIRGRDFVWSLLIATGLQLALLVATDLGSLLQIRVLVRQLQGPGASVPVLPYGFAAARIIFFYVLLGIVLGTVVYGFARVMVSQRDHEGTWLAPRRRYYLTFLAALAIVTSYLHLQALLLYPALFDVSWIWAPLAGSPTVVTSVGLLGEVGVLVACLVVLRKRQEAVTWAVRRWGWVALIVIAIIGGVFGARRWFSHSPATNRGPNVIVLVLDSIRPDHVSGFGYPRNTTPNLDRFLSDSVAFTDAFSPMARTEPSWMSLLTGCFPPRHGRREDLAPKESRVPSVQNLARELQSLGCRTSFFLDNSNFTWMDPEAGFSFISQPLPHLVSFTLSYFHIHLVMYYYCLNNRLGYCYESRLRANEGFNAVYDWHPFARDVERHLARMKGAEKFFLMVHTCIVSAPFSLRYPYSTFFFAASSDSAESFCVSLAGGCGDVGERVRHANPCA